MRKYEAMYIIRSNVDEEVTKATMEKLHAIIARGGTLTDVTIMGKRRLAYEIDDFRDGFYVLVRFVGDGAVVKELDRVFRITDEVLRFLIVVDESASA